MKTNIRVLGVSPSFSWMKVEPSSSSACWLGWRVSACMWATRSQPDALLCTSLSGSLCHIANIPLRLLKGNKNGVECCTVCCCALRGFSEQCPDCSLQSTTLYSLRLRETRHLRYSCHEHLVAFLPSLPRQIDCWRPDGTPRHTAVNREHFTNPKTENEQNQALPPKTQYCWRCIWGLPFVCN